MNTESVLETGAAVVGALGTVAAVVVALFLPTWQNKRSRPILSLAFDANTDDVALHNRPPWIGVWLRFRVVNERGRDTARKVRIIVSEVLPELGTTLPQDTLAFRELSWSEISIGELDIPAGMQRRIDIAHVDQKRTDDETAGRPWPDLGLGLAMWPRLFDGRDYLGTGSFTITLVVAGDNFDASEWQTRLSFDRGSLSKTSTLDELLQATRMTEPVRVKKR